jgi:FkbM family methyltransferase
MGILMAAFQIAKYIVQHNPVWLIPVRLFQAFFYQIYKRLFSRILVKKLFNGAQLYLFPNNPIASAFVYTTIPDKQEILNLRALADEKTIFIDVGANIGAYSLLLKDKVKAVYAFEAHPETAKLCRKNFALNHIEPHYVINMAVSSDLNPIMLTNHTGGDPTNHRAMNETHGIQVPATTLDHFIENSGFDEDLKYIIKVDVEGFEHEVLMGAQQSLANGKIKALVFENYSNKQIEILDQLKQLGYEISAVSQHNTFAKLGIHMRHESFSPIQLFDKFLSFCRYQKVFQILNRQKHVRVIYDMGCGSGNLVKILRNKGYEAFGIDVRKGDYVRVGDLNKPLPLASDSVDFITSLANLEHLDEPLLNLQEIYRVLREKGTLVLTTPSTAAKPVLECLAFKLKLIDPNEILDHKRYFSKKMLQEFLVKAGFKQVKVKRFQAGMNLHAVATK